MQIAIESTVGAGKTTLGKYLSEYLNIELYEELSNDDTIVLLNQFYKDLKRWSFALQVHYLNERFRMIKDINRKESGILDRSIYGDSIFAQMLNEDDNMTDEEYRTYKTLLNNMLEHVKPPLLTVYLRCSTDVAIKRLNKRNRGVESEVPLTYWKRLNEKYEEWYDNFDKSEKMVIEVDDFNVFDEKQRNDVLNQIVNKIKEIQNKKE